MTLSQMDEMPLESHINPIGKPFICFNLVSYILVTTSANTWSPRHYQDQGTLYLQRNLLPLVLIVDSREYLEKDSYSQHYSFFFVTVINDCFYFNGIVHNSAVQRGIGEEKKVMVTSIEPRLLTSPIRQPWCIGAVFSTKSQFT